MEFLYNEYFTNLFVIPFVMCVISISLMLGLIIHNVLAKRPLTIKFKIHLIISLFVIILLLIVSVSSLKHGVKLLKDDKNSVIMIEGEIEKIEKVVFSPRYMYNDRVVFAKIITINGEKYYCMTVGDLSIGDYVEVSYLENSRLIIKIDHYDVMTRAGTYWMDGKIQPIARGITRGFWNDFEETYLNG